METPDRHGDEPLSTSGDDGTRRYALVTDRPVEVLDPKRQFLQLNLIWATALLIVAAATAFAATEVSNHRSEQKIAVLLVELNRRYAERKVNEARSARATEATYRILEQNRRTHCSEMRAIRGIAADAGTRPETLGEIDKLYAVYHCGTARDPVVEPGWTPPPGWPRLPGAEPLASRPPSPVPAPAITQ